uniref:Mediator of RNA polymerase II transcription subunit 15 n=1 Tax=Oryzias latipes TaxID=8090 RepID=A0A3P9JAC4_ORYLA
MEVPGSDSDWRSTQFRQKVVAQIDEAMRKAGPGTTTHKSGTDMENQVYNKAKTRDEYLSLVARLIIHFRDIRKKEALSGSPEHPMNALTNLTGVGVGPGTIGMGPRPAGAQVGGMGPMGQMQIGQHVMGGVPGNPQVSTPAQMPMQTMVQQPFQLVVMRLCVLRCQQLPAERAPQHDVQTAAAARQTLCDGAAQHLGPERPAGLPVCRLKPRLPRVVRSCDCLNSPVQTATGGARSSGRKSSLRCENRRLGLWVLIIFSFRSGSRAS